MPGLDFYRQNYPEQFDGLNDYQALKEIARGSGKPIGEVAARLGMKEPGLLSELNKGIASGIDGMQAAGYGLGALGAEAVGASGMRDWFMKHAQANQREAQQNAAAVDDIQNIGSPTEFGYWAAHNVGSMLPQLPLGMTGAGAGGALVARKAAASAIEKAIASGMSATAAREVGKQAAAKASTKAAEYLGGAAVGAAQETGDIFLDIHDKTGEYQPGNALLHGIAAGSVENLPETILLRNLKAGRPKGMSRKNYIASEAAKQAVLGGVAEEGVQDVIEQNALSVADPKYQYDPMRTVNAAAAGAVGAGTIGGGFAAITPSEKTYAAARDPVTGIIDGIKGAAEQRGRAKAREEIAASRTPEEVLSKLFNTGRQPSVVDPLSEDEHAMDDATLDKSRQQTAMREAQEIVSSPAGMYPNHVREAAAATIASQAKWPEFRDTLKLHNNDQKSEDDVNELLRAAGLEDSETRNSLMRPTLTDNFGEQEGRDMDRDTVVDNFGSEVRTSPTATMGLPRDERGFGSAVRRVSALQKIYNNKATAEDAQKTVKLADALVRGGYWPKEVVDAAQSATQKENLLTTASTLITWMQGGMQDKAKGDSVVEALVRTYGDKVPDMMTKAYEEGVNSGLVERNDELFKQRRVAAIDHAKQIADHGDVVLKNLGTEWKNKVIKRVGDKWIVDKTTLDGIVKEVRRIASTGGDNVDNKVLEHLFPNKENRHEVLKRLYNPAISESTYKKESRSTKPAIDQEADDKDSVDFMREAEELLTGNPDVEDGQADDAFDSNQEVLYHSRSGGRAFRRRDKESREELKAKKAELGTNPNVRIEEVGVVDAAIDRQRRNLGRELTGEERSFAIYNTLKRYAAKQITGRPVPPPDTASDVSKRMYAEDKARWGQKLATVARQVNRSHIVLKTTSLNDEAKTGALDYETIRAMKLERKLDDPRNRPEEGTLWIENKTGGKLIVNASQILRAAFNLEATHQDVGFSGKTKSGDPIQIEKAPAQNVYDMLMRSMADISMIPEFTGSWGYVKAGGQAVPVEGNATLPNNFALLKANAKRKVALTMADVMKARKELSNQLDMVVDSDGDPNEMGLPTRRMAATVWEKLSALRAAAAKMAGTSEGKRLDGMLTSLEEISMRRRLEGKRGDDLFPVRYHKLISDWVNVLGLKPGTIDVAEWHPTKTREKDGLAAYDPEKQMHSDAAGRLKSANIGMQAQGVVGTSKKVDPKDVKRLAGPVPTMKTPNRAEDKVRATQQEAARQKFVDLLRGGIEVLRAAVPKMSDEEIVLFYGAAQDFKKQLSDYPHSIAKGYFGGNVDQARLMVARFRNNLKAIDSIIIERRKEVGNAARRVERGILEAFGERGQADTGGKEAGVVARSDRSGARTESELGAGEQGRNTEAGRVNLLAKLKAVKPVNEVHRRAINNLIAIVDGTKQGDLKKAQLDMVRWDGQLGEFSSRQKAALEQLSAGREAPAQTEVPDYIRDYDEEYGFDPVQAAADGVSVYSGVKNARNGFERVRERSANSQRRTGGDTSEHVAGIGTDVPQGARPGTRTDSQDRESDSDRDAGKRDQNKTTAEAASGSSRNVDAKNLAEQLKAYVDAFSGKNAFWDGAARKALASGDAKQLAGALASARKQFGELSTVYDDELYAHQRSKAVDVSTLPPNTPVWALYTSRDDGEAGNFVAAFKDMGAAQWLAERDGLTVVNELTKDVAEKKSSEQKPNRDTQATPEQMKEVEAELHRILGDDIKVSFADLAGKSGEWTRNGTKATITLAVNGDVMGTGFHEAIHQLFSLLRQHDGQATVDALQRVAMSPVMQGRLRKLLKDHPEAMAQLKDAEEAVAYMFQFWMLDPSGFKLGPETKTLFQKIKSFIDAAMAMVSRTVRERLMKQERTEKDEQLVDYLMSRMASGALADKTGRKAVIEALNKDVAKQNAAMQHLGEGYSKLIRGVGKYFATSEGLLESYNIPALTEIARMMHQRAGEAMGKKAGFLEEMRFKSNHYEAKINKLLAEATPDDLEIARSWLVKHPDKAHPSEEINKIVQGVHSYLAEMRDYIKEMNIHRLEEGKWVPIDFRKHYFPQVWDSQAIEDNLDQFLEDLVNTPKHKRHLEAISKEAGVSVEEVARGILQRVLNPMAQPDLEETTSDLGMTPSATAINRRTLDWLDMDVFDKYMSKDMGKILHSYTHNIIKRGEYQSRFGFAGEKLQELVDEAYGELLAGKELTAKAKKNLRYYQGQWKKRGQEGARTDLPFTETMPTLRWAINYLYRAEAENPDTVESEISSTLQELTPALKSIMAMEGTLGNDIDPGMRKLQNWLTTYQNFRVLAPGLFGSFMDIMGVVREGGEFKDAWGAFVAGIKEAKNIMQDKYDDGEMMQRAELFGTADAGSFSSAVGQHSQSVYMSGKAKEWSDKLFKYNGMEGWNRGVRAYATAVGERIIMDWVANGVNRKDKAEVARFERLYGEGFDPKDIKLDAQGRLDASDPKNIAAVNRWVHDAVIAPNAAHRPYWMSDPHFQIVSHLKSFSYSQHAVMLKQVAAQARLGNYRPALVSLLGYAPIAIAAGAIKEMLIPGDEPAWMKGGLPGYLSYGWERAGILGIPQMYGQNLYDSDPAAAFGPTANQIQDLLTVPFGELQFDVPLTDMKIGWRDHRTFEEIAAAAPFGSVLRRGGKNIDDWIAK